VGKQVFAVVNDRNWPPGLPPEQMCHYCDSPFVFVVYAWDSRQKTFLVRRRLTVSKKYSDAPAAMEGELGPIKAALSR